MPVALGSQLIDRNAQAVKLEVDAEGEAMLTYTAGGKLKHVLAWGAVNAIPPSAAGKQGLRQVAPDDLLDARLLGVSALRRPRAGVAGDGVHGARRFLLGASGVAAHAVELGCRADGGAVGVGAAPLALDGEHPEPADRRHVRLGVRPGWKRENSFLTHKPKGTFCYGFYPHGEHPVGAGAKYRATVMGPGVAPDVMWEGNGIGPYDAAADATANAEQKAVADASCKVN